MNESSVGRNVDEIFRLLLACKFAEEEGDVCPEKWKPGEASMKGSHDDDKTVDYFKEVHAKK